MPKTLIRLDFNAPAANPRLGAGLLLTGGIVLGMALAAGHFVDQEKERRAAQRVAQVPIVETTVAAGEIAAAQDALLRIEKPWNELFQAIEASDNRDVALLEFSPDAERNELALVVEARNLPAMLAYQEQLSQVPALRQVAIASHEIVRTDPNKPVRFNVRAQWAGR